MTAPKASKKTSTPKKPAAVTTHTRAHPIRKTPQKLRSKSKGLTLDLALQGGGSHGAFTWGVLDRLLDEEDITIEGISGTSAGAMNGAMLVSGMQTGGRQRAKDLLRQLWESVAEIGEIYTPFQSAIDRWESLWGIQAFDPFGIIQHMLAPSQLNPFNLNPLRDLLNRLLDIKAIQDSKTLCLFATATNVETGQARVFSGSDLTIDALLASACLPLAYEAVVIDGVPYWDGGYVGNPVIWPLVYNTEASDVLLVQINPLERKGTPLKMTEIANRLNEITFNSSLIAEMRAIKFVGELLRTNKIDDKHYKNVLMHRISMQDAVSNVDASSKQSTDITFLRMLHDRGFEAMEYWLKRHKGDIGKRETIDIHETFLAQK